MAVEITKRRYRHHFRQIVIDTCYYTEINVTLLKTLYKCPRIDVKLLSIVVDC